LIIVVRFASAAIVRVATLPANKATMQRTSTVAQVRRAKNRETSER
jgi:hypothetical protein